jgi:hypothetical protein
MRTRTRSLGPCTLRLMKPLAGALSGWGQAWWLLMTRGPEGATVGGAKGGPVEVDVGVGVAVDDGRGGAVGVDVMESAKSNGCQWGWVSQKPRGSSSPSPEP